MSLKRETCETDGTVWHRLDDLSFFRSAKELRRVTLFINSSCMKRFEGLVLLVKSKEKNRLDSRLFFKRTLRSIVLIQYSTLSALANWNCSLVQKCREVLRQNPFYCCVGISPTAPACASSGVLFSRFPEQQINSDLPINHDPKQCYL